MSASDERDRWLRMSAAELLRECREERYKASGPGGQRRNKVTTAVRLRHEPSGVVVQAEEGRAMEENRKRAVRRLRERIAVEVRAPFDLASPRLPAEVRRYVSPERRLAINAKNTDYPMVVATVLDALAAAAGGSFAPAAKALGVTNSQLARFLESDREVWRWIAEGRLKTNAEAAGR